MKGKLENFMFSGLQPGRNGPRSLNFNLMALTIHDRKKIQRGTVFTSHCGGHGGIKPTAGQHHGFHRTRTDLVEKLTTDESTDSCIRGFSFTPDSIILPARNHKPPRSPDPFMPCDDQQIRKRMKRNVGVSGGGQKGGSRENQAVHVLVKPVVHPVRFFQTVQFSLDMPRTLS